MKKIVSVLLSAFLALLLLGAVSNSSKPTATMKTETPSATFAMSSDGDVAEHLVVGGSYEPSGFYKITCTSGHGHLTDGNERGYMLAADEYIGTEHGSTTYAQSVTLDLKQSDLLRARNFHSTKFRLEFHYIGETLE